MRERRTYLQLKRSAYKTQLTQKIYIYTTALVFLPKINFKEEISLFGSQQISVGKLYCYYNTFSKLLPNQYSQLVNPETDNSRTSIVACKYRCLVTLNKRLPRLSWLSSSSSSNSSSSSFSLLYFPAARGTYYIGSYLLVAHSNWVGRQVGTHTCSCYQ